MEKSLEVFQAYVPLFFGTVMDVFKRKTNSESGYRINKQREYDPISQDVINIKTNEKTIESWS